MKRLLLLLAVLFVFAVPAQSQVVIGTCVVYTGTGSPEGVRTGKVCDLYLRSNGGASTTLYVKESGTNTTTGWIAIGGAGGAGAGWSLVTSATPSGTGGIMSFTSLGAYNEIMILYRAIRGAPDFGFVSRVRVSTDNGSSYLSSSGDYVSLSTQGVETNESAMNMHSSISSGVKTGWRVISNFNTTRPKNSWTPLDGGSYVIPTSSALNAVQIYTSTGLDWDTSGTIYIFGR